MTRGMLLLHELLEALEMGYPANRNGCRLWRRRDPPLRGGLYRILTLGLATGRDIGEPSGEI